MRDQPLFDSQLERWQSTDDSWNLKDLSETIALGGFLNLWIPDLELLLLKGPLGAGKTSLVKGFAAKLGIKDEITSPTFALAHHYTSGNKPLIHMDLYRLNNKASANELFLQEEEEAKQMKAVMIIEWPERLSLKLKDAYKLNLTYINPNGRKAQLQRPSK